VSDTTDKKVTDPSVREQVTDLLYRHLPALYRIVDMAEGSRTPLRTEAPRGVEELYKFLRVLAAPIAQVRQNVDELYADLFIDKSADWVLPYLAEMVGMQLVFPDAPSNRRDVRGTVGWRRRKGTPAMLAEMGSELSGQMVVTQEGWKRILLAQDLDLYRPERTIVPVRRAAIAELATGPLDAGSHAVDPRRISRTTGRYHPRHVAHWLHPTRLFPLREGEPERRNVNGGVLIDHRHAFHPLGADVALRIRRATPEDRVLTDKVPPMLFAEQPGAYFDQEGGAAASDEEDTSSARFTVRFAGLPAAVAAPLRESRAAVDIPAAEALVRDICDVRLLAHTADRLSSPVLVEVFAVPLNGDLPDIAAAVPRGNVYIQASGGTSAGGNNTAVTSPYIAMLKLTAEGGGGYFPGATVEISCQAAAAGLVAGDQRLAEMGFLSGRVAVTVPATWISGARWLFLAADGSVLDADPPGTKLVTTIAGLRLPGEALTVGPGPAWPPLPLTAEPEPWRGIPSATARGPVVIHGPSAVDVSGPSLPEAGGGVVMGLVFALRIGSSIRPFLRLDWTGPEPTTASTYTAFDTTGAVVASDSALQTAMTAFATFVDEAQGTAELWIRLESDTADIALPPCEVAFTSDRNDSVLIHLPELTTAAPALVLWPATLDFASRGVSVNVDGSTFGVNTLQVARFSCGPIVPIREAKSLRRRLVRQRTLCWWKYEDPMAPDAGLATPEGFLDIDPVHGLFAFAKDEPASTSSLWTSHVGVAGWPPPPVTVDCQEGYSYHVGARPDAREPVLEAEQPFPTRLVIGGGGLHRGAPTKFHEVPRYPTLRAALLAIQADGTHAVPEIVQIEDSATYEEGVLFWPDNIDALTVQAAELQRPVLRLTAGWSSGSPPTYTELTLRGLVFEQTTYSGDPPVPLTQAFILPPSARVQIQFCTATAPHDLWQLSFAPNADATIAIFRSITGRVATAEKGKLSFVESVVAAAGGRAVDAPLAEVDFERVTVVAERADLPGDGFSVDAHVVEISETVFTDAVHARDRFHGCVRYSRVEPGSLLPRKHRVTEDTPIFVTRDRTDPAHVRLSETCPRSIARGAEDGSEMGAFHGARLMQRTDALLRRLVEYTPAGLQTGLLRLD
jgi:hypothetical protein